MATTIHVYSPLLTTPVGSTGTGLDQLIAWDGRDGGLAGATEATALASGLAAADGLNRLLIQGLQALNLLSKEVLTSADIVEGKPHPEIYRKAAARLGVATSELLVFEDSQNGCRAAVAAGAVAVAVPGGHSRRHDFTGAHLVADTLADPRIRRLIGG